jgi:L,D-transpeptidase ErfK/SrfK
MERLRVRISVVVLSVLVLTGCAGLQDETDSPAVDAIPSPVIKPPIISDRFLLAPDQQIIGELQIIETREEDTFVDIARTYNLGFDELVDANPEVDPWLPGEGTRVILPTRFVLPDAPRDGIVVNLASKRLFYYLEPDEDGTRAVVTFPIGIGQSGSATPLGVTTVTSKGKDPVWYVPASIRSEYAADGNPLPAKVMPGPDNPLGSHVLILGMPSYLIHGTNRPSGVGMRVSHGCVRLFPENIEHLYDVVPVGVAVTIVNQPWLLGRDDQGSLYLEAHQPLADDERDWPALFPDMLAALTAGAPNGAGVPDLTRMEEILSAAQGIPLPFSAGAPQTAQVIAVAKLVNNLVVIPEPLPELLAQETGAE